MIDQRFMDSLYGDMALPPSDLDQAQQEGVLLAENKNVSYPNEVMTDTGGGAMVGYRLNMPKGLVTQEQAMTRAKELPRAVAATAKGAAQGSVGMYGDLEGLTRSLINLAGGKVDEDTLLPTTEKVKEFLDQYIPMGKENAPYEATGEVISPAGVVGLGMKAAKPAMRVLKESVDLAKTLPMGLSIKSVGEGVDTLGFYSAASKAVDSIAQEKGTGAQFLAQIQKTPGVKQEELLWTGLDDFLKGKKSVTKAEVQDYLNSNRVEVKEVTLGGKQEYDANRLNQLESDYKNLKEHPIDDPSFGEEKYDEMIRLMNIRDQSTTDTLYRQYDEAISDAQMAQRMGKKSLADQFFKKAELLNTRAEKLDLEGLGQDAPTKFSKYTIPGGENYREVLLTTPTNKARADNVDDAFNMWMADAKAGKRGQYTAEELASITKDDVLDILKEDYLTPSTKGEFRSQHFDQPNILAHLRVNDRVDADGKKVLFVEEVQSDWHQAGRKKGYDTPESKATMQKRVDELEAEREKLYTEQARLEKLAEPFTSQGQDAPSNILDQWNKVSNRLNNLSREWSSAKNALATGGNLVPDAPFKTTWHELAMKRAIQMATEGGYDRIAFTTGKTQAERYDLSKQIDEIGYSLNNGNLVGTKDGKVVIRENKVPKEKLEEYVGKDVAAKLLEKKPQDGDGFVYSSGLDLQVGGEGMKGFYDQILPKFLDKYGKKWDAKTGMTKIRLETDAQAAEDATLLRELGVEGNGKSAASVHYMDITPKMKESVLTKGQPMFQVAPAIPAGVAATQQEEKK